MDGDAAIREGWAYALTSRPNSGRENPPWSRIQVHGRCPGIRGMVKPAELVIVRLAQRTAVSVLWYPQRTALF
jgi:hypothetical protein